MKKSNPGPLIFRFGSGKDAPILKEAIDSSLCHGIVVSGHIGAYNRSSVAALLQMTNVPFFVDPCTWLLARDNSRARRDDGCLRKSFEKLAEVCGPDILRILEDDERVLEVKDFRRRGAWNDDIISDLVNRNLRFQKSLVQRERQADLSDLLQLAGDAVERSEPVEPSFLVAPYFYSESVDSEWYRLNVELARKSLKARRTLPVFGVVCIGRAALESEKIREQIVADWKMMDGILLWIDELDDKKPERYKEVIRGYVELISAFAASSKPIYLLYGSFWSLLLVTKGVTGVCCGVCYAEWKKVDQQRAKAAPPERYYVPFAKEKILPEAARRMYSGHPSLICDCVTCKSLKNQAKRKEEVVKTYFEQMKDERNLKRHFARCRKAEADLAVEETPEKVFTTLKNAWDINAPLAPSLFKLRRNVIDEWMRLVLGPDDGQYGI